jgi:hypothetical protein
MRARVGAALAVSVVLAASVLTIAGCTTSTTTTTGPGTPTATPPATTPTTTPVTTTTVEIPKRPVPPTSTKPLPSAAAADAMRAWYDAWFLGDIIGAQRTSTPSFGKTVDLNTFEGGDVIDYKVLGSEGAAGTIAFYISETRQEVTGSTRMTVLVTADSSGKGYLVKGYDTTPKGTVPAETVPDSKTAVSKADAQAAVTGMLTALQGGDVSAARAFATSRFAGANPAWFASAKGALLQYSIVRTERRHSVWLIQVDEKWAGEADTVFVDLLVSNVSGEARIDRAKGWY